MTKLSMHEDLPFDETTTPPRVSTGDLPMHAEIRQRRHRRLRALPRRKQRHRRGLHPRAGGGIAGPVRDRRGRTVGAVVRDRGRRRPFSIQSVSKPFVFALVCDTLGYEEARLRLGVNSTGFPFNSLMAVELNAERTMNPLVNAGAIATTSLAPGATADEKWASIRERLSMFAGRELTVNARSTPPSRPPTCATRASPTSSELRAALLRPRRGDRHLHPPVLAGRHRPRPRRDGGHPGQRRREPGHRRDGDQARACAGGCWP